MIDLGHAGMDALAAFMVTFVGVGTILYYTTINTPTKQKEGKPMKNFVGVTFAILLIMGCTIAGGYFIHQKVVKNELGFMKFRTYIQCVELNAKETCKFILDERK